MSKKERTGVKKPRSQRPQKRFQLGNYRIVTDTDETEKLYFEGLRDSLPAEMREKIEIVVEKKVATCDLVKKAAGIIGAFRETWIVFDRDRVTNFDELIEEATKQEIHVAWSNPCIEIWFLAYYGIMPDGLDSVQCNQKFGNCFKKKTGQKYDKNDKEIYKKLIKSGDEAEAIIFAKNKYIKWNNQSIQGITTAYSQMNACTLMFALVGEIRSKVYP